MQQAAAIGIAAAGWIGQRLRLADGVPMAYERSAVLLKNDGTGQAMAASGNTLKIRPVTRESV